MPSRRTLAALVAALAALAPAGHAAATRRPPPEADARIRPAHVAPPEADARAEAAASRVRLYLPGGRPAES